MCACIMCVQVRVHEFQECGVCVDVCLCECMGHGVLGVYIHSEMYSNACFMLLLQRY